MARDGSKKPLYRRVNTRTWGVRHGCTQIDRKETGDIENRPSHQSMRQGLRHGLDYTPLYRFLISRVGQSWSAVHSEGTARLDQEEPIWHLVARSAETAQTRVRAGESSYYSGLFVDGAGVLQMTDPSLDAANMRPFCACCTHTFNGKRFGLPYQPFDDGNDS